MTVGFAVVLLLVGLSIWHFWPKRGSKCQSCSFSKDCTHQDKK